MFSNFAWSIKSTTYHWRCPSCSSLDVTSKLISSAINLPSFLPFFYEKCTFRYVFWKHLTLNSNKEKNSNYGIASDQISGYRSKLSLTFTIYWKPYKYKLLRNWYPNHFNNRSQFKLDWIIYSFQKWLYFALKYDDDVTFIYHPMKRSKSISDGVNNTIYEDTL